MEETDCHMSPNLLFSWNLL